MSKCGLCFLDELDVAEERERQKKLAKQAAEQAATSSLGVIPNSDLLLSLPNSFDPFWATLGFESRT